MSWIHIEGYNLNYRCSFWAYNVTYRSLRQDESKLEPHIQAQSMEDII